MLPPGLYLHCAGALGPVPPGAADLLMPGTAPTLSRLLSRGGRDSGQLQDAYIRTVATLSNAALAAKGCGLDPGEACWFRAAPLQLVPDRDTLVVLGPETLAVTNAESKAIAREFNALYESDAITLHVHDANQWLLRVAADAPDMNMPALRRIIGRRLQDCLPAGQDAPGWIRYLNDWQMLLHGSAVSERRASRGQPRINGLWFWSGGVLPTSTRIPWHGVAGSDAGVQGLADMSAGGPRLLPFEPEEVLAAAAGGEAVLVDIPPAPPVLDGESFHRWESWISALDDDWLKPAFTALHQGGLRQLSLHIGDDSTWLCKATDRYRVWRRNRPLKRFLELSR